ncbi:ER protein with KEEL retention signal-like [Tropilaelaps mercedesae]|uniref:ER protein with KEEL retention signal-like n=1 Tax=Tropilaelaps mercedesae TaxID=418985 RepID=A0A1V9X536_9ACAR|nr:ER protein with KEEL retention signal-like [Tropilaelaps mercedesae]
MMLRLVGRIFERQGTSGMALSSLGLMLAVGILWFSIENVQGQNAEFDQEEIDVVKTKCEVCKVAVKILFKEVENTDPNKVIEVGSFRLRADGATQQRKVPYRGSEIQLHDLLDDSKICGGMKDYVPVTDKETGVPLMINMVEDIDKLSSVKFNPNPDFNSKMHTLCEELMGDHEDALMRLFKNNVKPDGIQISQVDFGRRFCIQSARTCPGDDTMEILRPKVVTSEEQTSQEQTIRVSAKDKDKFEDDQLSPEMDRIIEPPVSKLRESDNDEHNIDNGNDDGNGNVKKDEL